MSGGAERRRWIVWRAPARYGGALLGIGPAVLLRGVALPTGCRHDTFAGYVPVGPQYPAWSQHHRCTTTPPDLAAPIDEVRRVWYAAPKRDRRQWLQAIAGTIVPPQDVDDDVARRYYADRALRAQVEADRQLALSLARQIRDRATTELDPEVIELLAKLAAIDGDDWVCDAISALALREDDPDQYRQAVEGLRRRARNPGPSEWEFWGD